MKQAPVETVEMPAGPDFRTGYVSIVGRPNVGKSTLLNHLIEQKISIVSRKPQTTRWQIRGIRSARGYQIVFTDTPGYQNTHDSLLNRHMNREVTRSLAQVDLVLLVVEALKWNRADARVADLLRDVKTPLILVINKLDLLGDNSALLPYIDTLKEKLPFAAILPLSARRRRDLSLLERKIAAILPRGEPLFPMDWITDKSERFIAAEYIREKIIARLGDELPYRISVTIEAFQEEETLLSIFAVIWAEREAQRAIIIGENGMRLKSIGEGARKDLEKFFGRKVYLQTRVKTKKNWTADLKALKTLGYN